MFVDEEEEGVKAFFFASKNGSLLLLLFTVTFLAPEAEREREAETVVVVVEVARESDLKEGEEEEVEEEERCLGRGKEEVTSFPSFSWRQKAQIPPGFFVKGWFTHCIPSPISCC